MTKEELKIIEELLFKVYEKGLQQEDCNLTDFANKIKKKLLLHIVSQQRELLKKWWKYFDEESVAINCNDEEREEVINDFFNCG